jgi:putative DNA methylase
MTDDKRLIEDYLPIEAISTEASREKSVRKGHISTLHLWWARRPLVACRAAVYGALVPMSRFVPNGGSHEQKKSLGRANAAKFMKSLCLYPGEPRTIKEAQRHIFIAHADRLTQELTDWKAGKMPVPGWVEEFKFSGVTVTVEDITAARAPRPRVLDMFSGGGAIPLEALRLGCETFALDLNPVAHIIEVCTLVYPQKYGDPDAKARGMTGAKNERGESTWGGLAEEVGHWGSWVLKKVKPEIGDLYPPVPDPEYKGKKSAIQSDWLKKDDPEDVPQGYLKPVAYVWTRTVKCKNPACGATVPLVKQTWLCRKDGRYVAMKMVAAPDKKEVTFKVVEARTEKGLGFDPAAFSTSGNASCPWCGTVADDTYVKEEGISHRLGQHLMAVVGRRNNEKGKQYLSHTEVPVDCLPQEPVIKQRLIELCRTSGLDLPAEPIVDDGKNSFWCTLYGNTTWGDVFSLRQALTLLTFAAATNAARDEMQTIYADPDRVIAIATYLGLMLSRTANFCSTLCLWNSTGGRGVVHSFSHQAVPLTWDYPESNPLFEEAAGWRASMDAVQQVLANLPDGIPATVVRGNASDHPWHSQFLDAVITDPPYYDNISYADLSDFFYVWLKRAIGRVYPQHFAGKGSPKKQEIVSDSARHNGDRDQSRRWFEQNLQSALRNASKALKPSGSLVCVYAHKTTLGWASLVEALRATEFVVVEAWPLSTERPGGMKVDRAMLASSIFLVARKRDPSFEAGNYEMDVVPDLGTIVRERVESLWEMGISGADLVIACLGAGLRAFTKYARVEYSNGEEVAAERFLAEVETAVLETILAKLSKSVGARNGPTLTGLDPATRFYILWRYTYGAAELDAGEAIIFANGTHVELDGQRSLTQGNRALIEKKKSKYRLRDYTDRGPENALGQAEHGKSAPTVDALHKLLWLLEHKPLKVADFLTDTKPNVEELRLVAQVLAGPALKGGELAEVSPTVEQSALGRLLANWNMVMVGKAVVQDRRAGQERLFK